MKRKSQRYQRAVWWIADNDDTATLDVETVAQNLTTILVADVFGLKAADVAADVVEEREMSLAREMVREVCGSGA